MPRPRPRSSRCPACSGRRARTVAEAVLSRRPGVLSVDANPVAQTATVTYDPDRTDLVRAAAAGCATAATTAPGSRSPTTCATRCRTADLDRAGARGRPASTRPRRAGALRPARGDGPRRARLRCRWPPWSPTCATGSSSPRCCRSRSCCGPRSAGRCSGSTSPAPFGLRDDVFTLLLSPAGDLLLGVDLLRRRLAGAAGPHPGHDGAGRGRGRCRLALLASASP